MDNRATGAELIALERRRQIEEKRFGKNNDALWVNEELARAAAYYALPPGGEVRIQIDVLMSGFPINKGKHTRIEQLAIAGALVAAEIDRLKAAATEQD